jgi:RNA polymerase sigma-32 factor
MTASRQYTHELHTFPALGAAEQDAIAARYARTRDPADARRLVLANLRLVVTIARTMSDARRADWMDLIQEGNAGLMVAVDRFDPARGLKLSGYASIWIRAFMLRHFMEARHVVRSTTTREGRRRFFERSLPHDVSLDAPVGPDDGSPRLRALDLLTGDDGWRPDVAVETRADLQRLRAAVHSLEETLKPRERAILRGRLLCETPKPLRKLGRSLAVSGERVRQLEQDLLERLRALVAGAPATAVQAAA